MSSGCEIKKPRKQKGGMVSSPAAFSQGAPWNVESALPGMDSGVADAGNFYKVNPHAGAIPDPTSSTNSQFGSCVGGRRRKRRSTKKVRKTQRVKSKTMRGRKNMKSKKMKRGKKSSRKARTQRKGRKGRKMHKRRTMRGGSRDHILQGPVNAYRDVLFGAGDIVNQWSGKSSQLSPAPTEQAPVPNEQVMLGEIPDVNTIRVTAGQAVAEM